MTNASVEFDPNMRLPESSEGFLNDGDGVGDGDEDGEASAFGGLVLMAVGCDERDDDNEKEAGTMMSLIV